MTKPVADIVGKLRTCRHVFHGLDDCPSFEAADLIEALWECYMETRGMVNLVGGDYLAEVAGQTNVNVLAHKIDRVEELTQEDAGD